MKDHADQSNTLDFASARQGSVEWTNLCTLYLRAYESRLEHPVLGDKAAAEAVDRIDYDFARMRRAAQPWGNQFLVALRAKQLDSWAEAFLHRHPDAVVLVPLKPQRLIYRMVAAVPFVRNYDRLYRFQF